MALFDPTPRQLADIDRQLAQRLADQASIAGQIVALCCEDARIDEEIDSLLEIRSATAAKLQGVRGA